MTATSPDVRTLPLPPGRRGLPVLGETLDFLRGGDEFLAKRAHHGDVFRSHVFGNDTVFLAGPEAVRWVFAGENKYLANRWPPSVRRLLGPQAVAVLTGEPHRERRRVLTPHFSHASMRDFVPTLERIAAAHLARWAARPGPLVVWDAMRAMVFEIAVAFIVGTEGVDIGRLSALFEAMVAGLFSPLAIDLPFTRFGKAVEARRQLDVELGRILDRRRGREGEVRDVLGSLLAARDDAGKPLSREAILDELVAELFAGHDTTITASSNLMLLLADHPEVVEKARAEIARLPAGAPLDLDAIKALPYLQHVIHEGLRLIPPVAGGFRVVLEDVSYGGYRIPKGWSVNFGIRREHRSAAWPGATTFDPDRFARGEHKDGGCAFIPFGGGPRTCVGQHFAMVEMTLLLAMLLRDYTWRLEPGQDLGYSYMPFPKPRSGVVVRFERRVG